MRPRLRQVEAHRTYPTVSSPTPIGVSEALPLAPIALILLEYEFIEVVSGMLRSSTVVITPGKEQNKDRPFMNFAMTMS